MATADTYLNWDSDTHWHWTLVSSRFQSESAKLNMLKLAVYWSESWWKAITDRDTYDGCTKFKAFAPSICACEACTRWRIWGPGLQDRTANCARNYWLRLLFLSLFSLSLYISLSLLFVSLCLPLRPAASFLASLFTLLLSLFLIL